MAEIGDVQGFEKTYHDQLDTADIDDRDREQIRSLVRRRNVEGIQKSTNTVRLTGVDTPETTLGDVRRTSTRVFPIPRPRAITSTTGGSEPASSPPRNLRVNRSAW